MKIAYLLNQYPAVSHTFIRREIIALERLGLDIKRITIRRVDSIVDSEDQKELEITECLLESGFLKIIIAGLIVSILSPKKALLTVIESIRFGRKNERGVFKHLVYFLEACLLKRWVNCLKISHIHTHFATNSATVAYFCMKLGGPGYSFTVHGPEDFNGPFSWSLPEKIVHAKFVTTISHFAKSQLMRWCDQTHWPKIRIIRCTVDDSFLKADNTALPRRNRLVSVGRLVAQKGHMVLLEALKQISSEGVDFEMVLAGDGEMRKTIEKKIEELGLHSKVRITGWISGDDVKNELQSSLALILPSFAEGLPVVIMEALALGRPVLSTYVAGIPELVDHECGYLIPAGSVEKLSGALKDLLRQDRAKLVQMGEVGKKRVEEHHNQMIEGEKLLDIFHFYINKDK